MTDDRKPVIVGVDGSPASGRVLAWAHDLAAELSAPLVVVRAWEPTPAQLEREDLSWREPTAEAVRDATQALVEETLDAGSEVSVEVEQGPPGPVLAALSLSHAAVALVVGDDGSHPSQSARCVVGYCLKFCKTPVHIVHVDAREGTSRVIDLERRTSLQTADA